MNFYNNLLSAFRSLVSNKLRSSLTMLGIIIGVASVIAMISVGNGATLSVTQRIKSLGSNLLTIMPGSARSFPGGPQQAVGTAQTLTLEDAEAIKNEVPYVKEVSPEYSSSAQITYQGNNVSVRITGVRPAYEEVHNFHVAYGEFISEEDDKLSLLTAVLGQNVATDLFESNNPVGKIVKIKNIPFTVVGVMEYKGVSGFQSLDDQVFVPLSTAQKRLFGSKSLQSISVKVKDEDQMGLASNYIGTLLLSRHGISNPQEADFRIMSQADILSAMTQVSGIFTILLGGIAAISLVVGGIGIMNIMLVSVSERTREIGLRKAVGARRFDILFQFLIESVTLSLSGGALGVLIGFLVAYALALIGGWPFLVSSASVLVAFLFSFFIGVFFGLYPAWLAAKLNPITALRYE